MSIAENIAGIQARITSATRRANRKPEEVVLMAVSKTQSPDAIREAYAAGLTLFGESRVQEFATKAPTLHDLNCIEWHMIGHLQANKAAKAAELFGSVDSLDSLRLAERLNLSCEQIGKKLAVLIEINIGGEPGKTGVAPGSAELDAILNAAHRLQYLEFRGLMTVPPFTENPAGARPYFKKMRELREQIAAGKFTGINLDVLSMGMSHDFEIAIEEGSTCVRVGTAIFGERSTPNLS
jgi:pyridoxal phosphate enzyme (YggS family)